MTYIAIVSNSFYLVVAKIIFHIYGNTMATKNQIAQTICIMKTMQIISAKSHKQNCLEQTEQYRVGIVFLVEKVLCRKGFRA